MDSRKFSIIESHGCVGIKKLRLFAFGVAALIAFAPSAHSQQQSSNTPPEVNENAAPSTPPKAPPAKLPPGVPLEKMLQGGETHCYEIHAEAGQFLHATVEQHGIDVALTFDAPGGKPIATMDSPNGTFGLEQLSIIANTTGVYVLEIASGDKSVPPGKYKVRFEAPRMPTDTDKIRIQSERAFDGGAQLEAQQTADAMRAASLKYEASAPMWHQAGDSYEECLALNEAGRILQTIGDLNKAEELERRALELARSNGAPELLGATTNNMALIELTRGNWEASVLNFQEALPYTRQAGDRGIEGTILSNIGYALEGLDRWPEALDYDKQAISVLLETGQFAQASSTTSNMSGIYQQLGQYQKMLDACLKALDLLKTVDDDTRRAVTLVDIGVAYGLLGNRDKELDYDGQALPLLQKVGDLRDESITLNNMADISIARGEKQKALDLLRQSLALAQQAGSVDAQAGTLETLGTGYEKLGDKDKALDSFNESLALYHQMNRPYDEGSVLSRLMTFWRDSGHAETAIFFGKQAINKFQQLRGSIRGMDKESQKSFIASLNGTYRTVAAMLISDGRLPEAQQVLGLLKDEEYFEFIRRDGKQAASLTSAVALTTPEDNANRQYEDIANRVTAIGNEWASLRAKPSRTADEDKHLAELSTRLKQANQEWNQFLNGLYADLGKTKQAQQDVASLQENASGMQSVLRQLGTGAVALYTLVGDDKYRVILVTSSVMQAREYPIHASDLRKKVLDFRQALDDPRSNPVPQAQELYRILVGPIADDLEGAKATTLMWSLDDVLRYLPVAALHDGKDYLVAKYRNEVFTPASISHLAEHPDVQNWRGLAMGVSKAYGNFPALPSVPEELSRVVRDPSTADKEGVLPGRLMLDAAFTEDSMKQALGQGYPLIHIASHFDFEPGNETNSFLLLGGKSTEGTHLTLAELREDPDLTFTDTQLLTLSACDTAMGGSTGDGREVDGLGILAQQKGAKAVVASLWEVNDASTGLMMQEFYRLWTTNHAISKAEALRQAQLELLHGQLTNSSSTAAAAAKSDAAAQVHLEAVSQRGVHTKTAPTSTGYTHPYYWAPFILFGNWQ
jgi:CHAT domain-containing protein